ncbi:retrotransposon protein, putative, ty1-copia subclass [Tanacetum coccineum]
MTGAKFDIEKFDGTGDFGLWRIKMRALLIQHGCEAALEVLPADMEAQTKAELNKKAYSDMILCLDNKVLREVTGETTAAGVFSKLETLYMTNIIRTLCGYLALWMRRINFGGWEELIVGIHISQGESQDQSLEVEDSSDDGDERTDTGSARLDHGFRMFIPHDTRLDIVFDFLECDGGNVQLGDNRECKIRCIGKVRIQLRDGSSFVLHNVRYIPELKRNLILLGTLEKEGYTVKLQSSKVKVINGSTVILSEIRRDNCIYSLDGHAMAGELNASIEEKHSLVQVWRKRLGHISEAGLQFQCRKAHYSGSDRLCLFRLIGFVLGGIIGRKFKEWKQLVENQTGRMVKKLRTDNGLELYKIRDLLIQSGLPKTFWAEATCTAAYLINRSPSRAIEKKTPMEMWSGHPSDYGMLRIFGCVSYPHDKQGKLEPKVVKCVLLGYPEGVKGYRLYKLEDESPKIVTSRNVVFNETVMYKDTLKDSGTGDKSVEELQVEVELQRLYNHTPKEDKKDQEDGNDEDAGDQETDQPPDLINYQLVRDREPRTRTKPLRFQDKSNMAAYVFVATEEEDNHEPLTYQEAVACEDSSKWKAAMKDEMDSLMKNKTWELVDHLAGQKLVSYKWLFKIKEGIEGVQKPRYKARMVILALTAGKDYELEQLDVKMAFLHGNLEEVIYMRQPPGYEKGNKVCLLKKSLYGLKQSPRQWYRRFDEYMLSNGFKRSFYDNCVYYRSYAPGKYIYLLLYVDDMLIACKSKAEIGSTNSFLKKEFDMKELGEAKKILGMEIIRDRSHKILRVSQSGYVSKILNNFRIDNRKSVKMPLGGHFKMSLKDYPVRDCDVEWTSKVPYANAVGSLMYLMVCRRPDIAYAGTSNVGLVYGKNRVNHVDITGFVDSDYAKDPDKEAEYMALTEAVKTKHINVHYHFIIEVLEAKTVKVLKVGTEHNVADALTKVVPGLKLQHCLELLNVGVG